MFQLIVDSTLANYLNRPANVGGMTLAPRADPETSVKRTVDSETIDLGGSTTVTIDVSLGVDTEFFALHDAFSPAFADATVVSLTLDGSSWQSAVDVPAPDGVSVFYDAEGGDGLVSGSQIELVYELTAPADTGQHDLDGLLALIEADGSGEKRQFELSDDTVLVGQGIGQYADKDGIIRSSGLNQAVRDYLGDDLSAGLLNDVIQAYLTENPVT